MKKKNGRICSLNLYRPILTSDIANKSLNLESISSISKSEDLGECVVAVVVVVDVVVDVAVVAVVAVVVAI